MENNAYMNKIILLNLVNMYKDIKKTIPSLKKMKIILKNIGIKINHNDIENFLKKLQDINFDEAEMNGRKKDRQKNKSRCLVITNRVIIISIIIIMGVASTAMVAYFGANCIRDREVLEARLAQYKETLSLQYIMFPNINEKMHTEHFCNLKRDEAIKIRKKTWGVFGAFVDACTRVLTKKSARDSLPLLYPSLY